MAAFIIEDTIFTGASQFEANHHCNIGVTGFLCMPTYVLSVPVILSNALYYLLKLL